MSTSQPLEVVDRGSKTQPEVIGNLIKLIQQDTVYDGGPILTKHRVIIVLG